MVRSSWRVLALLTLGLAGCYHATIVTGLPPGTQTIERKWASSWIIGLVPPETVETMAQCPQGVARVETQLSFLNQLVGALTFSIYTPMSIVVTCAAGEQEDEGLARAHDAPGFEEGLRSGEPFLVELR